LTSACGTIEARPERTSRLSTQLERVPVDNDPGPEPQFDEKMIPPRLGEFSRTVSGGLFENLHFLPSVSLAW
jgi:hypothetical protein